MADMRRMFFPFIYATTAFQTSVIGCFLEAVRTSDLHLCCHVHCLWAGLDSLGIVRNSGMKLDILLKIRRQAYVQSRGRRPACSVCSAQCTSAAGVLQQIDDTLGKANGIAGVWTQHMLQVCLGLRNKVFYKDTSTRLHQEIENMTFQMLNLKFVRWDFFLPAMT